MQRLFSSFIMVVLALASHRESRGHGLLLSCGGNSEQAGTRTVIGPMARLSFFNKLAFEGGLCVQKAWNKSGHALNAELCLVRQTGRPRFDGVSATLSYFAVEDMSVTYALGTYGWSVPGSVIYALRPSVGFHLLGLEFSYGFNAHFNQGNPYSQMIPRHQFTITFRPIVTLRYIFADI